MASATQHLQTLQMNQPVPEHLPASFACGLAFVAAHSWGNQAKWKHPTAPSELGPLCQGRAMPHFCQDPPSGSSDLMAALHHRGVAAKAQLARSSILDLADAAPAVLQDKDALGSFVSILTSECIDLMH